MNEQILIQDTLKYFAECEYDEHPASRETLADELSMPVGQLDGLIHDLEVAGLIEPGTLKLTPNGREYALHVLRAHRLYETYLAQKTGMRDDRLHTHAHIEEHKLSAADVENLSRELDYPRFDPHGDPIPTATGGMPPKQGRPLTDYPVGWEGRVVHVEDHPPALYAPIYKASIAPGTIVRITAKDADGIQILTEGCSFEFPLDTGGQITVVPLGETATFDESIHRLSSLDEDQTAHVVGLSPLCRGLERNRLLDLGIVPGSEISVDLISPSGSPIAYRVRGASIALRRRQADLVLIRGEKEISND